MNRATKENLKRNFIKPTLNAAIGAFLLSQEPREVMGDFYFRGRIPFVSRKRLTASQFGAMMGFVSSFLVESLNNIVHQVDKKHRTQHYVSFITHSIGSMAIWALLPGLLSGTATPKKTMAVLAKVGFLSEMGSQYFHEQFVDSSGLGNRMLF